MDAAPHEPPAIFDETAYAGGERLVHFTAAIVNNRADGFIMRTRWPSVPLIELQHQKQQSQQQQQQQKQLQQLDLDTVLNLNPPYPVRGKNVYTMDPLNHALRTMVPVNRISVLGANADERTHPIELTSHQPDAIYDVNETLTELEMAIMVKYHAIASAGVRVTSHLHQIVVPYFDRLRDWFQLPSQGIVLTANHELQRNGVPIEEPLVLSGNPIQLQ